MTRTMEWDDSRPRWSSEIFLMTVIMRQLCSNDKDHWNSWQLANGDYKKAFSKRGLWEWLTVDHSDHQAASLQIEDDDYIWLTIEHSDHHAALSSGRGLWLWLTVNHGDHQKSFLKARTMIIRQLYSNDKDYGNGWQSTTSESVIKARTMRMADSWIQWSSGRFSSSRGR